MPRRYHDTRPMSQSFRLWQARILVCLRLLRFLLLVF